MAANGPDPREFLDMAQRMLRQLFDEPRRDDEPWADATRPPVRRRPEPSAEEQRENLTFALATRAVEALEDLALNVASIRQRLERTGAEPQDGPPPRTDESGQ
ncbi:hypothetical protein [Blastococcus haudaquaticus]|uniref:Uncharacterized protein n=1 Tax=Blastococcus haudaquaticus TaxID=1938745 RepID=A0A286GG07_9ACTN|nr:hypothetical protein [Blastococcus haudaquaticus]SOD94465.1 hypothetical protein SAMN06272739_0831 [Blastococcus haudaquaticus]